MNPALFLIPGMIVMSGVLCFFLVPMPFNVRVAILVADLVAAVIVTLALYRRFGSGR